MRYKKINIEWLKDPDFDERQYTQIVCIDGSYRTLDSWSDERDIQEISDRWSLLKKIELKRYYSPTHARWINDLAHKELEYRRRSIVAKMDA